MGYGIRDAWEYYPYSDNGLCADILSLDPMAKAVIDGVYFPGLPLRPEARRSGLSVRLAVKVCGHCVISDSCADKIS